MVSPWAAVTGPLQLVAYYPLPSSSRNNFPKFLGDGKVTTDEEIISFFAVTHILRVAHEDIAIRLFVETLIENTIDWFYHLDDASIIDFLQ